MNRQHIAALFIVGALLAIIAYNGYKISIKPPIEVAASSSSNSQPPAPGVVVVTGSGSVGVQNHGAHSTPSSVAGNGVAANASAIQIAFSASKVNAIGASEAVTLIYNVLGANQGDEIKIVHGSTDVMPASTNMTGTHSYTPGSDKTLQIQVLRGGRVIATRDLALDVS